MVSLLPYLSVVKQKAVNIEGTTGEACTSVANLWCYIVVDGVTGERYQVINEGAGMRL